MGSQVKHFKATLHGQQISITVGASAIVGGRHDGEYSGRYAINEVIGYGKSPEAAAKDVAKKIGATDVTAND